MVIVHLTGSPFFGGPERQMLGLAASLPAHYRSVFLSFPERGQCRPFLDEAGRQGFEALALDHNTPHFAAAVRELAGRLGSFRADVLCCHGYKADILGLIAGRRAGLPVIAVSRGWTAATLKVRVYEMADRVSLHAMDRVVCVSAGQAAKVRRAGVPAYRVVVIHNAIRTDRFDNPNGESYREALRSLFPEPPGRLVCAAGRLSPEKGFDVLVEAAAILRQQRDGHKPLDIGFVLFGDGPLRPDLCRQIAEKGLERRFILAGFRQDLDSFLPFVDLVVLPSFTEGLPNVALEAFASGVPVVATAVGGTPEVVEDGVSGFLVRPGDPPALASRILAAFQDEENRRQMGIRGRQRVRDHFTFEAQSQRYQHLFAQLNPVRYQESRRHHATPMMRPTS